MGAGNAFNVEEKDFINALYAVIGKLFENPESYKLSDFLAFVKCMTIVFINRRQYSNDLVSAFVKRLAMVSVHLQGPEQAGLLLLIKQILTKYPSSKSSLIELDDEGLSNAFQGPQGLYKADINDPQLSNASQASIVLELVLIMSSNLSKLKPLVYEPSVRLAKSILHNDQLPSEFLGVSGVEAVKKMNKE